MYPTQTPPPNPITIVFVGPPNSGKSCIVTGYTPEYKPTIALDFSSHTFTIDGKSVKFNLWDISASVTFNQKNQQQIKRGDIVAFTYAVDSMGSFKECQDLAERLLKEDKLRFDAKAALVATKIDLPREVSEQDGRLAGEYLKNNSVLDTQTYYQISSKQDKNVIQKLCRGFYKIHRDPNTIKIVQLDQTTSTAPPQTTSNTFTLQQATAAPSALPPQPPGHEYNKLFKILLLGDQNIGKTSILSKYQGNQVNMAGYMPTIGVDFGIKVINVHGYATKLQIWDTAGMKKFRTITNSYIKGCRAIILCYDSTNPNTFTNLNQHIQLVKQHSYNPQKVCKFLVATKIDCPRLITKEQGEHFAQQIGYQYMEVSALSNVNVEELFMEVAGWMIMNGVQ